jgi:tRNA threonylcarbamoyladenosine biosynthesis protein TsaB
MIILGIETSTAVCSVGLAGTSGTNENKVGTDICAERSIVESHIHSEKILSLIHEVCVEQKLKPSQIDGIAVSIGPGSFTGLRIGLSTAKGLCCAVGIPLIGVPTFKAIAAGYFAAHAKIVRAVICIDAKQGDFYIGVYDNIDSGIHEIVPVQIGDLSYAQTFLTENTAVITDSIDKVSKATNNCINLTNVFPFCRGDVVAKMAFEKMGSSNELIWEKLEPMYLKDFTIKVHPKK